MILFGFEFFDSVEHSRVVLHVTGVAHYNARLGGALVTSGLQVIDDNKTFFRRH
jgi:hypothetical protein